MGNSTIDEGIIKKCVDLNISTGWIDTGISNGASTYCIRKFIKDSHHLLRNNIERYTKTGKSSETDIIVEEALEAENEFGHSIDGHGGRINDPTPAGMYITKKIIVGKTALAPKVRLIK